MEARELTLEYLRCHPCVDCGNSDIRVLHFDHIDPSTKTAGVMYLVKTRYGASRVMDEIAKCEVRCANCHAIRTSEQGSWLYRK
jgi:hypothetical protein